MNDSSNKSGRTHNLDDIVGNGPPAISSGAARAEAFYAECLRLLSEAGIPFPVGGTLPVSAYTGLPPPVAEAVDDAMRLENALRMIRSERRVVVLHYSPITATLAGEAPKLFPFLGSSRLAETVDRYEVNAVLHGHAHHGTYSGATARDIPAYNCAQHVVKENGRPYALIEI